jgi:hypothetical protein
MRLYIHQCSDPMMWYASKVGQYVTFLREDAEYYWSREDAGYSNIVLKTDATIVA